MYITTPFELVQAFPAGRTLAIVGNAPSLMGSNRGAHVDSHDTVVRFNECAIDGFERDVGARLDILVANPYPEKKIRRIGDGRSIGLVLIINPQTRRGDLQEFSRWVGEHRVLFTYTPDLVGVADSTHQAGLTTGTYGIQLLTKLLVPSKVLITGFTMFGDPVQSHYWHAGVEPGVAKHDFATEPRVFVNLLNSIRAPVEITPDVADVAARFGMSFDSHVRTIE
jgi:hypothetical protein